MREAVAGPPALRRGPPERRGPPMDSGGVRVKEKRTIPFPYLR
jgi:hypothetical protein